MRTCPPPPPPPPLGCRRINPVVNYSTLLGGNGEDAVLAVASTGDQWVWFGGWTTSTDLPVTPSAWLPTAPSGEGGDISNGFLGLAASNGQLVYLTYVGGTGYDRVSGLAVDPNGGAWVSGITTSTDFPVSGNRPGSLRPAQATFAGGMDSFVLHFTIRRAAPFPGILAIPPPIYSTYLGAAQDDFSTGIALLPTSPRGAGNMSVADDGQGLYTVVVCGHTNSPGFRRNAFLDRLLGVQAGFITQFSPTGTILLSGFIGGDSWNALYAAAGTDRGTLWAVGETNASTLPVTNNAYQSAPGGGMDGMILLVDLNTNPPTLAYLSYLGGADQDSLYAVGATSASTAWVGGRTGSQDFPTSEGAQQNFLGGGTLDAVYAHIFTDGSLIYSSYLGGGRDDQFNSISVTYDDGFWAGGHSQSPNMEVVASGRDPGGRGKRDGVVVRFDAQAPFRALFIPQSARISAGELACGPEMEDPAKNDPGGRKRRLPNKRHSHPRFGITGERLVNVVTILVVVAAKKWLASHYMYYDGPPTPSLSNIKQQTNLGQVLHNAGEISLSFTNPGLYNILWTKPQ
eukprot:jgi/Mesvir1/27508/Mv07274-RA.1